MYLSTRRNSETGLQAVTGKQEPSYWQIRCIGDFAYSYVKIVALSHVTINDGCSISVQVPEFKIPLALTLSEDKNQVRNDQHSFFCLLKLALPGHP